MDTRYIIAGGILGLIILVGAVTVLTGPRGDPAVTRHLPETAVPGETIDVVLTMDITTQTTNLSVTDRAGNGTVLEAPGGVADGPYANWFIEDLQPTRQNLTYQVTTPLTGTRLPFNGSFKAAGYNGTITGDQEVALQ